MMTIIDKFKFYIMKKFILIISIVLFSFSLESSVTQDLVLEQDSNLTTGLHYTHTDAYGVDQFITLTLGRDAVRGHYKHPKDCFAPCQPPR
jgi:hypothetical protein